MSKNGRIARGLCTPEKQFLPILAKTLLNLGGEATSGKVIQTIKNDFGSILNKYDYQRTKKFVRWQHHVHWARNTMVDDGLLLPKEESGHGYWKLSPKGVEYAKTITNKQLNGYALEELSRLPAKNSLSNPMSNGDRIMSTVEKSVSEIVKVSVPLKFGGAVLENIAAKKTHPTLKRICNDYLQKDRIDFHPPYQRQGDVWKVEQKRDLIGSILNGMAIPPLYFCPISLESTNLYPVDGLQRLETIKSFLNGEFPVHVLVVKKDGSEIIRRIYYEDLMRNDDFVSLKDQFLDYELEVVTFDYVPLKTQRSIFIALNNGTPLSEDENNYCENYLARRYLGIMWDELFSPRLINVFSGTIQHGRRFKHIRVAHELLMMVGGEIFGEPIHKNDDGNWFSPPLRAKERHDSAKTLHKLIENAGLVYTSTDKSIRSAIKLNHNLNSLREMCNLFAEIFVSNPTLGTEENADKKSPRLPRNVLDPLAFFFAKMQSGEVDIETLRTHNRKIVNLLKEYYTEKVERDYRMATSDAKTMIKKFDLLEELYNKKF